MRTFRIGFGHNARMPRRVHLPSLTIGSLALPQAEAHHVRDVLRVAEGESLELFDTAGNIAAGIITHVNSANVVVSIESIQSAATTSRVIVASAIPKGERADWMIEKLSELGVSRFIPLAAERSVTLPGGRNKFERWERIAIEAAKQSRRAGIMSIAPVTSLVEVLRSPVAGWWLSTAPGAVAASAVMGRGLVGDITLMIGPEGGWTDGEMQLMDAAGLCGVGLTASVLRVETAAVVAAGFVLSFSAERSGTPRSRRI
jgi:16S rRNA (uracil1498-N3)-methyltransferase